MRRRLAAGWCWRTPTRASWGCPPRRCDTLDDVVRAVRDSAAAPGTGDVPGAGDVPGPAARRLRMGRWPGIGPRRRPGRRPGWACPVLGWACASWAGPAPSWAGPARPGLGLRRPGLGLRRPGLGLRRPGLGLRRPGLGLRRPGTGRCRRQPYPPRRRSAGRTRPGPRRTWSRCRIRCPGRRTRADGHGPVSLRLVAETRHGGSHRGSRRAGPGRPCAAGQAGQARTPSCWAAVSWRRAVRCAVACTRPATGVCAATCLRAAAGPAGR